MDTTPHIMHSFQFFVVHGGLVVVFVTCLFFCLSLSPPLSLSCLIGIPRILSKKIKNDDFVNGRRKHYRALQWLVECYLKD